ncbi:MAG: hypothetical protein HY649_08755 [Acidobacteria bacterium]|nr:hypothetical protein [Acidobacteriota bacterium]
MKLNGMRRTSLSVAVGVICLLIGVACDAQGQSQPTVELSLGSETTSPGAPAQVPVILFARETKVGKVAGEVTFPKELLSFVGVARGSSGDEVNADISTKVIDDSGNSKLSVLKLAVSATQDMPNGVLLTLRFRVSPDAEDGFLKLANRLTAMSIGGEEIGNIKTRDGEVSVSKMQVLVPCFFFTH